MYKNQNLTMKSEFNSMVMQIKHTLEYLIFRSTSSYTLLVRSLLYASRASLVSRSIMSAYFYDDLSYILTFDLWRPQIYDLIVISWTLWHECDSCCCTEQEFILLLKTISKDMNLSDIVKSMAKAFTKYLFESLSCLA